MRVCSNLLSGKIIAVLILLAAYCHAGVSVTAKASTDRKKISIGDKVNFKLLITSGKKTHVYPLEISNYFKAFEIKGHDTIGPKTGWFRNSVEYRLLLSTYTTGSYVIPEITVKYKENGEDKEIKTEKVYIEVEGIKRGLFEKDDIRDIKNPMTIPRSFIFYLIVFGLPILLAAGYIYYRYSKLKASGRILSPVEPERAPDEAALERLTKLKEAGLLKDGRIKEYYIILSEIIRQYLEGRFNLPIVESTTAEAHRMMQESGKVKIKDLGEVKEFLEECDLVKFAKFMPKETEFVKDFETAERIVNLTKEHKTEAAAS
jgi:hypothetical protein